ncbi:MAG: hydrolase [Thauera phenolivorans]|uniref:Hydrolase n=1 Tax=Thauera phenolivorans TaxID=1792543 RepID=A0A7X7LVL8_9RHOO|nr:hydrolase [Thauera phenolivorans]NLF53915.1 hydrolase [Thauera phenolivorans]
MERRLFFRAGGLAIALALAAGVQAADDRPADAPLPEATQGGRAEAPPLPPYRSSLDAYRPYRADEPLRAWKEANDEVGRLGGHMGHLTPAAKGGER